MNCEAVLPAWLLAGALVLQVEVGDCSTPLTLGIKGSVQKVNLSWPATMEVPPQGTIFPEYTIERSTDLTHWEPIGGRVRGQSGVSGPLLNLSLDALPGRNFYRVAANPSPQAAQETGSGGAEVFGYNDQFAAELARLGLMPIGVFATNTPQPPYLPRISWDPTTAQFWTNFNASGRPYDFRLDTNELAVFRTNGFVVSERLGSASFADAYYKIFNDDLPVFITADSILQAWHRTYDSMLEELEELQLATLLEPVINNSAAQLPEAWAQYGGGALSNSILDADYFLTVARNLWATQQVSSSLWNPSVDARVRNTLICITNQTMVRVSLFGPDSPRWVDFSQFTVRGHYNNSDRLRRYFKTIMLLK